MNKPLLLLASSIVGALSMVVVGCGHVRQVVYPGRVVEPAEGKVVNAQGSKFLGRMRKFRFEKKEKAPGEVVLTPDSIVDAPQVIDVPLINSDRLD